MIKPVFFASTLVCLALSQPAIAGADPLPVIVGDTFTATGNVTVDHATGAMTGEGIIRWNNGEYFEGRLHAGNKQGHGVFVWRDGQRYEGDWLDDRMTGQGRLAYANGDIYEGTFLDGEPHGIGTYTATGGSVYRGAWVHGQKQGIGRLTWEDGDYWEGEFSKDQPTENGKLVLGNAPDEPDPSAKLADARAAKRALPKKAK